MVWVYVSEDLAELLINTECSLVDVNDAIILCDVVKYFRIFVEKSAKLNLGQEVGKILFCYLYI